MRSVTKILTIRDQRRRKVASRRLIRRVLRIFRSRSIYFLAGCIVLFVPAPGVYRSCCEAWEKREQRLAEASFHARMAVLPDRVGNFIAKDQPNQLKKHTPEIKRIGIRDYIEAKTQQSIKVYLIEGLARHVGVEHPGLTSNVCYPRRSGYLVTHFRRNAITVPTPSGSIPLNLSVLSSQSQSKTACIYCGWTDGKRWVTESPHTQLRGWSPAMRIMIVSESDSRDEAETTKHCEDFIQAIIPQIAKVLSDNPL